MAVFDRMVGNPNANYGMFLLFLFLAATPGGRGRSCFRIIGWLQHRHGRYAAGPNATVSSRPSAGAIIAGRNSRVDRRPLRPASDALNYGFELVMALYFFLFPFENILEWAPAY